MNPPTLIALSPGDLDPRATAEFARRVGAAFEVGLRGVLLREPHFADREFLALAQRLRERLDPSRGGWLAVHDRPHLSLATRADAVHLGNRSLAPAVVRAWLPNEIAIGLSTHTQDDPKAWTEADYLFHGPVFETRKADGVHDGIGVAALARAVSSTPRPIWALGGLRAEHARDVASSGARGMAVLSGILSHADAALRARAYLDAWPSFGG